MFITVIGLGNSIAGDDGVGVLLAERLEDRFAEEFTRETVSSGASFDIGEHTVLFKEVSAGGLFLLDHLLDSDRVLIMDAVASDAMEPGDVFIFGLEQLEATLHMTSPHDTNLATAVQWGRTASPERMPDVVSILGVKIVPPVTFSEELSPVIEAAVPRALSTARSIIDDWIREGMEPTSDTK